MRPRIFERTARCYKLKLNVPQTICRLCKKTAKLANSHIIPEFVFRTLYDKKHRFRSAQLDERKWEWEQKGYREPMLCDNCEQKFSIWEHYASEQFFNKPLPTPISQGNSKAIILNGLNYQKLKLFLLSILWRAGVTTHVYYKHVQLGHIHEERLRQMLLSENPGSAEDYACFICTINLDGNKFRDFFVEPTPSRVESHRCYRFVFSGFIFYYHVTSHRLPDSTRRLTLQLNGKLTISETELAEHPFLRDTFNKAKDAFESQTWE